MNTYTIDSDNNIHVFASPEQAASSTGLPFESFTHQQEFEAMLAAWPKARVLALWNTLPGVQPMKKLKSYAQAVSQIWSRIQLLEPPAKPPVAEELKTERKPRAAKPASVKKGAKAASKPASRRKQASDADTKPRRPIQREDTKMAQVIALLERKDGAALPEIMEQTGWQRHTVRGFIAGTVKRGGFTVESFRSENGDRTYRIQK